MGHTCTGKPWPFGAKAHIGADADSALVHSVELTAANVADVTQTVERLHGEETRVHADAGYSGVPKREEAKDLEVDWSIAEQRGKVLAMQAGPLKEPTVQAERLKATIRARVEYPFRSVKNLFRQRTLRYRGLAKTGTPWRVLFALANRVIAKKAALLASCARGAPDIRAHRENGRMSVRFSRQACSLCESGPKNRAPSAPGQKWANRSAVPQQHEGASRLRAEIRLDCGRHGADEYVDGLRGCRHSRTQLSPRPSGCHRNCIFAQFRVE